MTEYYLFLDESKPNREIEHFCLGGCIIEKENYINRVIPFVKQIKQNVFGNTDIILHETEIRRAKEKYSVMSKERKREVFWKYMRKVFRDYNITVLSAVVTPQECRRIYDTKYLNDEYFIALQIILENFVYFLEQNNGRGSIYLESRNPVENNRLQHHYFELLSNGTMFFNKDALQKYLSTISFPLKADNIIGLQLADFIPNVLKKKAFELNQRIPTIVDEIVDCLYDGGTGREDVFGMKKIP